MKLQFIPIFTLVVILIGTNVYGQSATATETIKKSSKIETYKIERIPIKVIQSEKVEIIAEENLIENKKNNSAERKAIAIEPKKHIIVKNKDK